MVPRMGGIGISEVIILGLIVVLVVGIAGAVALVTRIKGMTTPIQVYPCRACGRAVAQDAPCCPQCGAPRR
jgi:hypothetical protein